MKKVFLLFATVAITSVAFAQSICDPNAQTFDPGSLFPDDEELDCIVNAAPADVTIYFRNFDEIAGTTVDYLIVDSISNMPCGVEYALDQEDKNYSAGEYGCIRVLGTPNDEPGQYKLGIWVTISTPLTGILSGEAGALAGAFGLDFTYIVRLKEDAAAVCAPLDTTPGATNLTTPECVNVDFTSINEITNPKVGSLSIAPTFVTNETVATFEAIKSGNYVMSILSVDGKEVSSQNVSFPAGTNQFTISRNNLTPGVYFLFISNGNNNGVINRFVVGQ